MYPAVGTFVLIRPAQTFYERINLTNLQELHLDNNQVTGNIPSSLSDLANLSILDLSHNRLTGELPPSLGHMTNLAGLYINDNQLSGDIPSSLGNLTKLSVLYLKKKTRANASSCASPAETCEPPAVSSLSSPARRASYQPRRPRLWILSSIRLSDIVGSKRVRLSLTDALARIHRRRGSG